MSYTTDVTEALVLTVKTALDNAAVTDSDYYTVDDKFTPLGHVDAGQLPFAQVYGPASTSERLDFQQTDQTLLLNVLLLRPPDQEHAIRSDVEAVIAELESDPRIEPQIRDAYFTAWDVDPTQSTHTVGQLFFICSRVTD